MAKRPRYCRGNSVFVAWFKEAPLSETPGMRAVVDEIAKKEAVLVVPAIVYTEFMEHHTAAAVDKFRTLLKRSNVHAVSITLGLAEEAESTRTKAAKEKPSRGVKAADALCVACATAADVDMVHTSDDGMLKPSGSPTIEGLKACLPRTLCGGQTLC